jgi:hypothetical protein
MRFIVCVLVFVSLATTAYAASVVIIPYGDYSEWCCAYGVCKDKLDPTEAELVIERYFVSRGLIAVHMRHKGRFVEADIYRKNRLFDKIIFDRKTGRIRSIY